MQLESNVGDLDVWLAGAVVDITRGENLFFVIGELEQFLWLKSMGALFKRDDLSLADQQKSCGDETETILRSLNTCWNWNPSIGHFGIDNTWEKT